MKKIIIHGRRGNELLRLKVRSFIGLRFLEGRLVVMRRFSDDMVIRGIDIRFGYEGRLIGIEAHNLG